jgi:DNA-binding beta-propeller fold protein YncE
MRIFQFTGIWMRIFREVSAIVILSTTSCLRAVASPGWTVSDRIPVGGDGNWDYVTLQAEPHRLYVAHQDRMVVIDLSSRTEICSIPGQEIHGVALVPELNRGFVSDGDAGNVILFDLKTLEVNRTIQAQPDADAICYEPVTRRIFTFNGDSRNTTIIDAVRAQIVGTLSLDGQPEFAQTDGRGAIFVNIEDKDEVLKIDAAGAKVIERWRLPARSSPCSMGIDLQHDRLFIGCRNQTLLVVDSLSGKNVATLPIGKWVDATVYDPVRRRVFACCGDGTLTVVRQDSADSYAIDEVVQTELGVRTMAFDSVTNTIYAPSAKLSPISPQDPHPHPHPIPGTFHILVLTETAKK